MNKYIKIAWFLIALTIFISHRIIFFAPGSLEVAASYAAYPLISTAHIIARPFLYIKEYSRSHTSLHAQIKELEKQNHSLTKENIRLKALITRYDDTHDLREFQKRYSSHEGIMAKVISKQLDPDRSVITLNKGSHDGVQKQMAVVHKYQLVGRVETIYPHYCTVTPIIDTSCKVAGYSFKDKTHGIIQGNGEACTFNHISHLSKLTENDYVLSSGQGMIFPEGFCLGSIEQIKKDAVSYEAHIKPLIDLKKIEYCVLLDRSILKNF